ncbi:MAG TPA: N-acyl homoserine lactonase family protein [Steroidobacteraceae bacterium]|nr:N-acyl homoserine lactonase family protein [Steroidobacteraceae bacterium]
MKPTKVYLLDCGTMSLDRTYMFLDAGLSGNYRFPVYGVLVDHEEGRFLFDTGFDLEHIRKTVGWTDPLQTAEQTIPAQLNMAGFRPEEISHVINSHYHLDHCGGNKHCKHATTVCHVSELETLRSPAPSEEIPYSEVSFAPGLRTIPDSGRASDMFTPRFETLKGDQEIASGVFLFETLGHTAGHYSLMVKLKNRRPMLFTADACYSQQNLDLMCIQAGNHDPAVARGSLQRLKDLAEKHDAELFFSHDAASWPKYLRAPGSYS